MPSLGVPIDIHIGVPDQHWTPPLPRYRTIHVADTAVVLLQESRIIRFSLRTSERLSDRSHGNHLVQPALGIRTYQNDHPRQRESRPDHTAGSRPSASESSSARLSSLGTSGNRPSSSRLQWSSTRTSATTPQPRASLYAVGRRGRWQATESQGFPPTNEGNRVDAQGKRDTV
jgi:hypothetical protein